MLARFIFVAAIHEESYLLFIGSTHAKKTPSGLFAALPENALHAQSYQQYVRSLSNFGLSFDCCRPQKRMDGWMDGWLPFAATPTALVLVLRTEKKSK